MSGLLSSFWRQPCRRYRNFQLVFTMLTLNFVIPAITYATTPAQIGHTLVQVNELLGGAPYTFPEEGSRLWRYLGAANVMTLGLMCLLLQVNLRKWRPVLVPLAFLKAYNATLFLSGFVAAPQFPGLLAVALFDYLTTGLFLWFTPRAYAEIQGRPDEELVPRPRGRAGF